MRPYRTFVDVQEMLDAKEQMFKNQDQAVFELFGRVVYSSRENFQKKQYFQLRSLLKEQPPYINGTLIHWELKQDPRAKTGWVVIVLEIRQSGWKEIQKVMDTLGRKDLDEPSSSGN
ncbi:hypothetical protein FSOLCH5_004439 [Fusarium solani]